VTTIDLQLLLHRTLGALATDLGWEAADDHAQDVVTATLAQLGAATVEEVTDTPRLIAVARQELWRAVANATVGFVDVTGVDGGAEKLSQIHAHAVRQYEREQVVVADQIAATTATRRGTISVPVVAEW
jgi:hypothetical protein